MTSALINGRVLTPQGWMSNHAVIIDEGNITAVLPSTEVPVGTPISRDLQGRELTPGFIDLQVNGGGDVMFNSEQTVTALNSIALAHRQFGTTGMLPTLITTSYDAMRNAISAVEDAISQQVPGILGIHLEGPFLNSEKSGAHDASQIRPIDPEGLDIMNSLKSGITLVTLAPELTDAQSIRKLTATGVVVCAGHSNANYKQTRSALKSGVQGFTHLYNAMTPMQSREPGMVGAAIEDPNSWFGIIADGHHSHRAAFRLAVRAKQPGGAILVTDSMATVGGKRDSFVLDGEVIAARDGRCINTAGALAGSDLDMLSAVNNTCEFADLPWEEAVRMASIYPARALGLDKHLGEIRPGMAANLIEFDTRYSIAATWIHGHQLEHGNQD